MATLKKTAYNTITVIVSSGASIANNARSVVSAAQGGDAVAADLYGDWELVCTFATAPTLDTTLDLYVVRSVDGTNYEDGSDTVRPAAGSFIGAFQVRNVTTSQRMVIRDTPMPPGLYRCIIHNNNTGQTVSAGWTLKVRTYNIQSI